MVSRLTLSLFIFCLMLQAIYCVEQGQHDLKRKTNEEFTTYPMADGYENDIVIKTDECGNNDQHQRCDENDIRLKSIDSENDVKTNNLTLKYKQWAFSGIFILLVNSTMITIFYEYVYKDH